MPSLANGRLLLSFPAIMPGLLRTLATPFLPPVHTARHYTLRKFRRDVVAGLTVSVVELPQAMAYALIAGVPPEYGIYTSVIQGIVGALLSSSEHMATGPTNTQSLLVASAVSRLTDNPQVYLELVFALATLKGLFQLSFAALRMGSMVRFVSRSVIVGVAAGAGVLIAFGQLPHFLGITLPDAAGGLPGVIGAAQRMTPHLGEADPRALWLGVACVALVVGGRMFSPFAPGALLAVVLSAAAVKTLGWDETTLPLIGQLPRSLPSFHVPDVTWPQAESLLGGALALAILGMLETVAIAKSIAAHTGERISANQEFFAQGLKNFATSFFQCIPGSGSFTRSALDHAAGAETRFAAVLNGLFVGLLSWLFADYARYIPLASLAAVLLVIAVRLMDWRYFWRIARVDRAEAAVCLATFLATVVAPLQYAIFVGLFLSLATYLRKAGRLHLAQMVPGPGGRFTELPIHDRAGDTRVLFLQVEGDLFFAVADDLQDHFDDLARGPARVVILRLKRMHSIDATALEVLERFARQMQSRGGHVLLCGIRPPLMTVLTNFGLVSLLGHQNVFPATPGVFTSARRALDRAKQLVGSSIDTDGIATDEEPEGAGYQI